MNEEYAIIWHVEDTATGRRSRMYSGHYTSVSAAADDVAQYFAETADETRTISATILRDADVKEWMYDTPVKQEA